MKTRYILFLILGLDALILFFQTTQVSISPSESRILYGDFSFLQQITKISLSIFGQNDFGLHFSMIFFHLLSALLIYEISKRYIFQERNRLWLLLVFVLLPGVISSAIVVNSAGMIIFGLLLFVYLSEKISQKYLNILLGMYSLIDIGFAYLFLSLSVYYFSQKKYVLFIYSLILYLINSYLYGFNISGLPSGHFLDIIGVYSAIFTPIIFVYIFYSLYRRYLTSQTNLVWYISSVTLVLSLVLSFRQRVNLEYFAPYLIIALPIAAQSFINSYRVRLKMYRLGYKLAFIGSFVFLISNALIVIANKNIYPFLDDPQKHFAYKMHVAKELSDKLKKMGIKCVSTDEKMQLRLRFYNISRCDDYKLSKIGINEKTGSNVTISYNNRLVYRAYVTKINKI